MIEAEGLAKRYGHFEAVRGVTFRIGGGQVVGLLGPNGAGKTSIMRILTCYHFPSGGSARVASHDVTAEPHQVRARVGYLPESSPLYADMKVREYLGFIADARELSGKTKSERIGWAVETCGLQEVYAREIRKLSRGYRQRAGLAQAILHDPPVLVLDEPTSGLDPNQITEIRALIRSLGARKTVLLSTHILREVEALCAQVLIMNEGRLVAQGSAGELARGLRESVALALTVKGPLDEEALGSLRGLPGVRELQEVRRFGEERTEVLLAAEGGSDLSEAIYDWAVARQRKILGLTAQRTSLEELFARLTSGAGGADA
jgi:ABC-2 type transport system ATP-binding protein